MPSLCHYGRVIGQCLEIVFSACRPLENLFRCDAVEVGEPRFIGRSFTKVKDEPRYQDRGQASEAVSIDANCRAELTYVQKETN